ncbi:hypothetical protein [Streptomyces sp. AVP053U2]|uniref:hypothetical protein n=1 Tax=Streptomyces sp. AVP053U2 TaxID=1737066 RepID=UPI00073B0ADA|nr:hypothetical protein [Streptomyces sp. AVP053U2]ODA75695.1 hypothetical protein APS67_000258 [Streptomyces sp. AVP053U2]
MTQSGQGEEPSARPAREGIVLPSDGGEPLLPGMTGPPAGPVAPGGTEAGARPPGGQTWGTPWGPEQQTPPAPQPPSGQEWQSPPPAQQWGAQEPAPWDARGPAAGQRGPGPLPPEGAQAPVHGATHGGHSSYDPAYGPTYDQSAGGPSAPMPPQATGREAGHGGHRSGDAYGSAPEGTDGYGQQGGGAALPPQRGSGYGAPAGGYGSGGAGALPDGSEGATQFMPPVPAAPVDEGATQFIPPVGPGALPPEMPAAHDSESTRYLGLPAQGQAGRAGGPPPPAGNPDAEATQFMAPVTDGPQGTPYGAAPGVPAEEGNRQPPAEFDNLFRASGGEEPAGSTQQMPRVEHQRPPASPQAGHGSGGGRRAARENDGGGRGGRTGSKVPLIAAVGVGLVVLGVGAGALLGGGGDDGDAKETVSATAPASGAPSAEPSAEPSVDPVRQQAVELDKLLAHSGDSRSAVINAVEDVKACKDLQQAAKDLREAAGQRNQLVTDLSALSVDELPEHAALTAALTKAWQASASADNHYAAWADQTAGKKGCKKGQARSTGETAAATKASGTATAEKTKAAELWNAIAKQHGLTERQPTQL